MLSANSSLRCPPTIAASDSRHPRRLPNPRRIPEDNPAARTRTHRPADHGRGLRIDPALLRVRVTWRSRFPTISPSRQRGRDCPRCFYVSAREQRSRLGARTPAWVNRHATKLPRISPLTEFCSGAVSFPHLNTAFGSGNKRSRQSLRPRGVEPHSPKAVSPEKYPWPITTDR